MTEPYNALRKIVVRTIPLCMAFLMLSCARPVEDNPVDSGLAPAPPQGLTLFYNADGVIYFEWLANSEPDLSRYNIYRSDGDSLHFRLIGSTTDTFFENDTLDYTTIYFYELTAVDTHLRESAFSRMISGKPLNLNAPHSPANLTCYAENWTGSPVVTLYWDAPTTSLDVDHYEIFRSVGESSVVDTTLMVATSKSTSYRDTASLLFYKTYAYAVRSVDRGNLHSTLSTQVSDIVLPRPVLLAPEEGANVALPVTFSFNGLQVPAQYQITVSESDVTQIWSQQFYVSQPGSQVTLQSSDLSLEPGKSYYWRVAVYSKEGHANVISASYRFTVHY